MTVIDLRSKLIKIINSVDENYLKKIVLFIKNENEYQLSDEHKHILEERLESYEKNPKAGKSWEKVKDELIKKHGL